MVTLILLVFGLTGTSAMGLLAFVRQARFIKAIFDTLVREVATVNGSYGSITTI